MTFLDKFGRRLGVLEYLGTWNASTNTPALVSGVGQKNGYYIVSVTGSTLIDGRADYEAGDWIVFNGTSWEQVDNQHSSGLDYLDGGTAVESTFDSNLTIDGGSA
jgi:hypothetical protein